MTANVQVLWNPSRVNGALAKAFRTSAVVATADALKNRPNKEKIGVKGPVVRGASATIIGTGLAATFEKGRKGNYPILPGGALGPRKTSRTVGGVKTYLHTTRHKRGGTGSALQFLGGDKGFAAYAIGGPMAAQPFLHPAAARWATIYYPQAVRGALFALGAGSFSRGVAA